MKFSALINNYNYGRYLGETIESVLRQTHANFELLVVDDGSTDNSRSVIESFHDPRLVPILKENGGQASAFKAGFARATGDYVAFLDADDLWDPNKLQRCAEILQREKDIVLLNHLHREIGETVPKPAYVPPPSGPYDFRVDLRCRTPVLPFVSTSFFLGRIQECRQIQFDDLRWRIAADAPVRIGLALRGKTYNLNEILGSYRIHASSHHVHYNRSQATQAARRSGLPDLDGKEDPTWYVQSFYQLANEEQARLGLEERFDFFKTDHAISYHVFHTSKYSLRGIYWRLANWLHQCGLR